MRRADYAVAWLIVLSVACTLASVFYAGCVAALDLEDERARSGLSR